jgi:hypothetical protein
VTDEERLANQERRIQDASRKRICPECGATRIQRCRTAAGTERLTVHEGRRVQHITLGGRPPLRSVHVGFSPKPGTRRLLKAPADKPKPGMKTDDGVTRAKEVLP